MEFARRLGRLVARMTAPAPGPQHTPPGPAKVSPRPDPLVPATTVPVRGEAGLPERPHPGRRWTRYEDYRA